MGGSTGGYRQKIKPDMENPQQPAFTLTWSINSVFPCISLYFIGGYLFLLRSQKWQFGVLKSDVRDQIHVTNKWYRKRAPSYVCWFTEPSKQRLSTMNHKYP
jgi:hypothetical protein